MDGNIPGGNFLGGNFPEGSLMGGNFPGGSFPDTENNSDESGSVKMRYNFFFNLNQKRASEILTVVAVMMRKKVLNIK